MMLINDCLMFDDENIFKKFEKDEGGKYYNIRLQEEITKRQIYSKSRSANKLGKTKKDKIISKSYVNHMGNGNGNINSIKYEVLFNKVISENSIFLPDGFYPLILEWLKYKSEKKQQYKETGLKTFINKLIKDTGSNLEMAKKGFEYSMSKNYDGLFFEKETNNIKVTTTQKPKPIINTPASWIK